MLTDRRDFCCLLSLLVPFNSTVPAVALDEGALPSGSFDFAKLPVEDRDHAQGRHIMKGKLVTGEAIEVHETTLPQRISPCASPSRLFGDAVGARRHDPVDDQRCCS